VGAAAAAAMHAVGKAAASATGLTAISAILAQHRPQFAHLHRGQLALAARALESGSRMIARDPTATDSPTSD